jgi:uncharacterized membrane protein
VVDVIILVLLRVLLVLQLSSFPIKILGVLLVLLKSMCLQARLQRELLRD